MTGMDVKSLSQTLPAGGMRAAGNATTKHNVKVAKNQPPAAAENTDPNVPQEPLDGKQTEPKVNPQNHPDPGTRGKKATFTGQIKTESEIPGDITPIDNNNPTDKPAPVLHADPSAKTDPAPGVDPMAHLRSLDAIRAARKHPSNGTVKISRELADAAKLAGAKIKKNLYGQPIGIEYRVRGMGKLKMRIDERGEITSSVTSLNPAANPREMTSIFLQKLQKNIPQTDAGGTSANLSGLFINLTTGEMSFNGEPIANFPIPGQNIVSYTYDKRGNFNLNFEALKDPRSYTSQMMRAISSLHGGSGSALNNVSDSYNKMFVDKQQFQLSPFTIRNACAEIDITYDALAGHRDEIKKHIREPDVLLTIYSKHLQEAKDRGIQEDQLVQHAIETTIRQYQTLTGNNLGETNMAYAKEFLTALNLDKAEGYAVEDLEIEDINNAVISAGIAAAAIEINFVDFSEKLNGEIPPINNQACPDIGNLNAYVTDLANNDLGRYRHENPVIRDIVQGFGQQGIEKQDENKFNAFRDSANSRYRDAGSLALLANVNFRTACQAIVPQQNNQFAADLPQPAQEMLLKAAWLVDSNPAISKENAPYLIVGTLKDKPEFQNVSLQDLTHLAGASIALKDAMAGPNSPHSLLQQLDFKDPANCQRLAEETGQPVAIKKFDDDGLCIGATLYQPKDESRDTFAPVEFKYNDETQKFVYEKDPNARDPNKLERDANIRNDLNVQYNFIIDKVALKFDFRADKIKVAALNPAPAGDGKKIKDENPLAPGHFGDEDEENSIFDDLDDLLDPEGEPPPVDADGGEGAGAVTPGLMTTRPGGVVYDDADLYD